MANTVSLEAVRFLARAPFFQDAHFFGFSTPPMMMEGVLAASAVALLAALPTLSKAVAVGLQAL
jgi:hypothetical protein